MDYTKEYKHIKKNNLLNGGETEKKTGVIWNGKYSNDSTKNDYSFDGYVIENKKSTKIDPSLKIKCFDVKNDGNSEISSICKINEKISKYIWKKSNNAEFKWSVPDESGNSKFESDMEIINKKDVNNEEITNKLINIIKQEMVKDIYTFENNDIVIDHFFEDIFLLSNSNLDDFKNKIYDYLNHNIDTNKKNKYIDDVYAKFKNSIDDLWTDINTFNIEINNETNKKIIDKVPAGGNLYKKSNKFGGKIFNTILIDNAISVLNIQVVTKNKSLKTDDNTNVKIIDEYYEDINKKINKYSTEEKEKITNFYSKIIENFNVTVKQLTKQKEVFITKTKEFLDNILLDDFDIFKDGENYYNDIIKELLYIDTKIGIDDVFDVMVKNFNEYIVRDEYSEYYETLPSFTKNPEKQYLLDDIYRYINIKPEYEKKKYQDKYKKIQEIIKKRIEILIDILFSYPVSNRDISLIDNHRTIKEQFDLIINKERDDFNKINMGQKNKEFFEKTIETIETKMKYIKEKNINFEKYLEKFEKIKNKFIFEKIISLENFSNKYIEIREKNIIEGAKFNEIKEYYNTNKLSMDIDKKSDFNIANFADKIYNNFDFIKTSILPKLQNFINYSDFDDKSNFKIYTDQYIDNYMKTILQYTSTERVSGNRTAVGYGGSKNSSIKKYKIIKKS